MRKLIWIDLYKVLKDDSIFSVLVSAIYDSGTVQDKYLSIAGNFFFSHLYIVLFEITKFITNNQSNLIKYEDLEKVFCLCIHKYRHL